MTSETHCPFYQRLCYNLLSLSIICLALIYGKTILLPLACAILLANLLLPVTNFLVSHKIPKILSIFLPLLMSGILIAGILYFLTTQVMHFINDAPELKERIGEVSHSFQVWFSEHFNMTIKNQNEYFDQTTEGIKEMTPQLMGKTFVSITGIATYVVLVPVFTFLTLFYRKNIKMFLVSTFRNGSEKKVTDVLNESTSIAQHYLIGLLIETSLVFALNAVGFLILGIKYAIFLALLAALLNLIPYVGILVANVLCMLITLVSSNDGSLVLWVGIILAVVQFLDNNFGMPLIVGNKVRINALVTILGILIGGALCGIPGMFLAIPTLAVLKVIFDKVPELKPWGMLLGDTATGAGLRLRTSKKKAQG